ncbi:RNA polymerase sigma-70 factor (ECF subfamily) [Motilibacter peucedani]|uniref:RNA polymerase sigma-70 factor (ECF subfamily) n=1 Tax=Motilibacter peucedani TaxID=598650 RepID=A0A420XMW4_9ACTN|nr:sigma-70 family RNA polymerase sigma factor [Motilibacter peucedani]RKS72620.1 RNA polymerase sigma-70 factor (ECF subfamily) [Motilibacter peucedani]
MTDPDSVRFTRLYEEHHDRVLAYASSRVPPEQAADAVAETFLVAWRRLRDVPGAPLPWLLVVARNTISQQRRSAYRRDVLAEELARLHSLVQESTGDVADSVAERLAVLTALTSLSPRDREALMLTAWDGLAAKDAALVAGCSPATFAVRLHRARRRLAVVLEHAPPRERSRTAPTPAPVPSEARP